MPSPAPDQPGLLIRDPYRYSDAILIVPPPLVGCLRVFDGHHTQSDLRETLVRLTGDIRVGELQDHLIRTLGENGFLEDDLFEELRESRHREFAEAPKREPVHAGSAYPEEIEALNARMARYMDGAARTTSSDNLCGIAAPHVSPDGGWRTYRAAYSVMPPGYRDRTFVILGTSHYGQPERFGLTRKPFRTPLGEAAIDQRLVSRLCEHAGPAVQLEDYCHSIEHSIEFQVLFLQHVYGPEIRILPILCGQFARSIHQGGGPEDDDGVRAFLGALCEMASREGDRLFWVLGIDMAHIGRRYGDEFAAVADQGEMEEVAQLDAARIREISKGNAENYWALVQEDQDDLRWCGASPLYTFMRAMPGRAGNLIRYEQWNIDPRSVVSFAALSFS